jgi:hypothetical protein
VLFEIFFDGFLGFADVDGKKNEALRSEFLADFVDEGSFIGAITAPGGPKLEQRHFSLDGIVCEFFTGGGHRGEARGRFPLVGAGGQAHCAGEQSGRKCAAEEDGSHRHAVKISQIG